MSLVSFLKALSNKQKIGRHNSASKRVVANLLFLLYIRPNFCFDESSTQLYKELKIDSVTSDPSAYKKSYDFVNRIKGV